jgi:uncharacterized membrane protein
MQNESRPPPHQPSLQAEIAKAAQNEEAPLKAGLAKLAQPPPEEHHLGTRLRNYLLTGMVVVGPVGITLYIAWYVINMVDAMVKPYVPPPYNPDNYLPFPVPGVGLVFAVILLALVGWLAANLIGRWVISAGELALERTPIVRNVYHAMKQIFESVITAAAPSHSFQKVALMEFPSEGIWTIVFVTGEASTEISKEVPGEELVSVFLPTGLIPPAGFVCFVPRQSVLPIKMSIEDASKIIISAGMVNPETQSSKLRDLADRARNGSRKSASRTEAPPPAAAPPPPAA